MFIHNHIRKTALILAIITQFHHLSMASSGLVPLSNTNCLEALSHHANYHVSDYRQLHYRPLESSNNVPGLEAAIGSHGVKDLKALKVNSHILDVGGGFSAYGVELARKGHWVVNISSKDYWAYLFSIDRHELERRKYLGLYRFITEDRIKALGRALGIEELVINEKEAIGDQFIAYIQRMKAPFHKLVESGRYRLIEGLAHQEIAEVSSQSFDRVIDAYGAFYCSSCRFPLVYEYFRVLRPGGLAYVSVGKSQTQVYIDGEKTPLASFLSQQMPDIFFPQKERQSLTIERTDGAILKAFPPARHQLDGWINWGNKDLIPSESYYF